MESDHISNQSNIHTSQEILPLDLVDSHGQIKSTTQLAIRKPTSLHLKTALLSYFRYKRQWLAGEEVDDCDVLVIDKKGLVYDIEVKISKSDLWQGEAKKRKHKDYLTPGVSRFIRYPNYFYICVPSELIEEALKWVEVNNPKYGVIEFNTWAFNQKHNTTRYWEDITHIKRKAKALDCVIRPKWAYILARRLSSAVCVFKQGLCRNIT